MSHVDGLLPKPIYRCSSEDSATEAGSKVLILRRPVIGETTRRSKIWLWATACRDLTPFFTKFFTQPIEHGKVPMFFWGPPEADQGS